MIQTQRPNASSYEAARVLIRKKTKSLQSDCDLLTRTSWTDAAFAFAQIKKGKANGNKYSLLIRAWVQKNLFLLGCKIQRNPGIFITVGIFALLMLSFGLAGLSVETNIKKLWIEEGGRLQKELAYKKDPLGEHREEELRKKRKNIHEDAGSTMELVIQTPKVPGANVLSRDSLLAHLQVLKAAVQVTVEVFDITWSFKDVCLAATYPIFDKLYLDKTLENIFPCSIITPLDCFWEGSKLLGPEIPVTIPGLNVDVQWTNLNPQWLMQAVKSFPFSKDVQYHIPAIESFMKRSGISTAYQEKPCLLPSDPGCPSSSPNKQGQQLDIGATLTGGCYGFATKYMHWPEDLIAGGITKNKTGHIIRAEALESIIQLMGEEDMYNFWNDHMRTRSTDWDVDSARIVLKAWQRRFTQVVLEESQKLNVSKRHTFNAFSTTSLNDVMKDFSEVNLKGIIIGYITMLLYVCVCLVRCYDPVHSQVMVGVMGVLLVTLSVSAGLGCCGFLKITFNPAVTQIVPFVALGIGVNNLFLIVHQYSESSFADSIPREYLVGEILKNIGMNIALTSTNYVCAIFVAFLIPIPALRSLVLQFGILAVFNAATMLFVFPAIITYDIKRRSTGRADIFCCYNCEPDTSKDLAAEQSYHPVQVSAIPPSTPVPARQTVTHALPPDGSHVVTVLAPPQQKWPSLKSAKPDTSSKNPSEEGSDIIIDMFECHKYSPVSEYLSYYIATVLQRPFIKCLAMLSCIVFLAISVWGMLQVRNGLELTDIIPRNTQEYDFLSRQSKYFGFYNMHTVTKGNFEYPNNQQLLYEYHAAFTRIDKIIKNDDGGMPEFWLAMFRDWLLGLQAAFDVEWSKGCISEEGWCNNATDDSILAYKLLVQTGRNDNPIDKSLVRIIRLVDKNGIIYPKAFYNYLSAWATNDVLAYASSQASLIPEPKKWYFEPDDFELKMPKSKALVYAQMPFFLKDMSSTEEITDTIHAIRAICQKFEEKGLPNFPTGIPFTYWEQYLNLPHRFWFCIAFIFVVVFLVISILLFNVWAAGIVVVILAVIVVELFGFMGLTGIKFSAVPAVILISSVGMGVEFTVHLMLSFLTSIGDRQHRMVMTLQHMFVPVMHGATSTLIGVFMLAFTDFDFIFRYFFTVLCALVVIGMVNGLLIFPVILSYFGPPGELLPLGSFDRLPTPSPEPSPQVVRPRVRFVRPRGRVYPRVPSEISLSTITEESGSCHSAEIVVEPEVTVETTTVTNVANGAATTTTTSSSSSDNADSQSECTTPCTENVSTTTTQQPCGTTAVTTRVTATAKVKVEVHAPIASTIDYRHKRRRDSCSSRSSSARSSPT